MRASFRALIGLVFGLAGFALDAHATPIQPPIARGDTLGFAQLIVGLIKQADPGYQEAEPVTGDGAYDGCSLSPFGDVMTCLVYYSVPEDRWNGEIEVVLKSDGFSWTDVLSLEHRGYY